MFHLNIFFFWSSCLRKNFYRKTRGMKILDISDVFCSESISTWNKAADLFSRWKKKGENEEIPFVFLFLLLLPPFTAITEFSSTLPYQAKREVRRLSNTRVNFTTLGISQLDDTKRCRMFFFLLRSGTPPRPVKINFLRFPTWVGEGWKNVFSSSLFSTPGFDNCSFRRQFHFHHLSKGFFRRFYWDVKYGECRLDPLLTTCKVSLKGVITVVSPPFNEHGKKKFHSKYFK